MYRPMLTGCQDIGGRALDKRMGMAAKSAFVAKEPVFEPDLLVVSATRDAAVSWCHQIGVA